MNTVKWSSEDWKSFSNKGKEKDKLPNKHEEDDLQMSCIQELGYRYQKLLIFAIPNGGRRSKREGARLKKAGVLAGVADLFLSEPSGIFHGLYIELKSNNGRMEDSQKLFRLKVLARGYQYVMCRTTEQFLKAIQTYLEGANNGREQTASGRGEATTTNQSPATAAALGRLRESRRNANEGVAL